jgi:tetratricopeptide (TPR) repeat protein
MEDFFYNENTEKTPEEIALESAVQNALKYFEARDFQHSLPFIIAAIEICEQFGVGIPNLYLMRAYAEMELGEPELALVSINKEIENFPFNSRAFDLKFEIELSIQRKNPNFPM